MLRWYHKMGIGLVDLLILTVALMAIYFNVTPSSDIGLITTDAIGMLIIVVVLYVGVVAFASICLTYMREDNFIAKLVKSLIMTIVIVALFNWALFPVLWIFGYDFVGEVGNILIIASVVRTIVKIFLRRRFGGNAE